MKQITFIFLFILCFACNSKKTVEKVTTINTTPTVQITKKSIAQSLQEIEPSPIAERIALYKKLKKEHPEAYNFEIEDEMTMYGYRHLWDNKLEDALEIFKLIVSQFPNSSNPYDSLGEAYLALGDSLLAIKYYEKSLQLNPDNFNAEDQIERIKFPNKKSLTPAEKFDKIYTQKAYKDDLQQLGEKLIEVHPNALKYTSKKQFWETIELKKSLITSTTTFAEFAWHCIEIIALINCSHTSVGSYFFEDQMLPRALRFPLQTRLVNEKLYVVDAYANNSKVAIRDEITHINGVAVAQLIPNIYKHLQSQGYVKTSKTQDFNQWSTIIIPYTLNFPKKYTVILKGKETPIALLPSSTLQVPYIDTSIPFCGKDLCLEVNKENNTAIMKLSSFNYYPWNNLEEFQQFIDESFKEIKDKNITNLIIDVRFNGGGSPESSIYLLKYLAQQPFYYFSKTDNSKGYGVQQPFRNGFKGTCYFLIDGNGKSTTGHFMALVKELKLGTIIGEELGSNHFCTAGQTILRLTNTKLVYYVANSTSQLVDINLPDEKGILPDYPVYQSIEDYLNNIDTVKEFTLQLIDKNEKF